MAQYLNFPPGYFYDYGRDGSEVAVRNATGVLTQVTQEQCDVLQRWNTATGAIVSPSGTSDYFVVLFPQTRTITGGCWGAYEVNSNATVYIEYSLDTTNGVDGNWVTIASANGPASDSIYPRTTRFFSQTFTNIKAVRLSCTYSSWEVRYLSLWTTDDIGGLTPWHPTNDEALSNDTLGLDRGDIFVNAVPVTQTFRIKNTHGTQTANDVVVSIDAGKGMALLGNEVTFSLDDTTYTSSITIPSIAPGAISPLIYMYRPMITDAAGTTRVATVLAKATTWS